MTHTLDLMSEAGATRALLETMSKTLSIGQSRMSSWLSEEISLRALYPSVTFRGGTLLVYVTPFMLKTASFCSMSPVQEGPVNHPVDHGQAMHSHMELVGLAAPLVQFP